MNDVFYALKYQDIIEKIAINEIWLSMLLSDVKRGNEAAMKS